MIINLQSKSRSGQLLLAIIAVNVSLYPTGQAEVLLMTSKKGCWRGGKLYAHGTKIPVPMRSRLAIGGHVVCQNGTWKFVPDAIKR